jgi:RES domain-containing protein
MGVENVGNTMVDAPFEAAIQILVDAYKVVTVVVSDVRVGLSGVIAESIEMVVVPVFVGEKATCVALNKRCKAITDVVIFL